MRIDFARIDLVGAPRAILVLSLAPGGPRGGRPRTV